MIRSVARLSVSCLPLIDITCGAYIDNLSDVVCNEEFYSQILCCFSRIHTAAVS